MDRIAAFWSANRNEILMTGLIILLIQLATTAGGYLQKRKNMRRIGDEDAPS